MGLSLQKSHTRKISQNTSRARRQPARTTGHHHLHRVPSGSFDPEEHSSTITQIPTTEWRTSTPAGRRAAINTSAGVRTLTTTAWARAALDDHRDGQAVVCTVGGPPASGPSASNVSAPVPATGAASGSRITIPACAYRDRGRGAEPARQPVPGARPRGGSRSAVACGRARDYRHLRRRDVGPLCHGADHRCVCTTPGSRTAPPLSTCATSSAAAWTAETWRGYSPNQQASRPAGPLAATPGRLQAWHQREERPLCRPARAWLTAAQTALSALFPPQHPPLFSGLPVGETCAVAVSR